MIRLATVEDAEQLEILNSEFNGQGETGLECIRASLLHNRQEIVIVDDKNGELTGFICIQLKKSFCYNRYLPEVTELYVRRRFRRQGIASEMLSFAENYCKSRYPVQSLELLTGEDNFAAQAVYKMAGYEKDRETHMQKQIEK